MRDDSSHQEEGSRSRRSFLGKSAGIAGFSLGSGSAFGQRSPFDSDHPKFAAGEHDHSGEHAATARLGEHAPVETITVETLRTKGAPVRDVTAYGAVGDGETDDAAAIQAALDDAEDGDVVYLPSGTYASSDQFTFYDDERSVSVLGAGMGSSEVVFTGDEGGFDFEFTSQHDGLDPQTLNFRGLTLRTVETSDTAFSAQWPEYDVSTQSATFTVRDLALEGPWDNGIYLYHAWNSLLDNIKGHGQWEGNRNRSTGSVIELDGFTVDTTVSNVVVYGFDTGITISNEAEGTRMVAVTFVAVNKGFVIGEGLYFTILDSHVNGLGNGPALEINGASEVYLSGCLLWNIFGEAEKEPTVRYVEGDAGAVGQTNGLKIVNTQLYGTGDGLEAVDASEVSLATTTVGFGNPGTRGIVLENVDKAHIVNNVIKDFGVALDATQLYNGLITGNTLDTDTGVEIEDGINNVVDGNLVYENVQYLVRQETNNNVPENVHDPETQGISSIADTYGQSFSVPQGFDSVEILLANYENENSAFTMTLYEGTPADGDLTEVDGVRVDGFLDNALQTLGIGADEAGTYYLEMSDPDGTPTWWWYEGEDELVDVGGKAFVDRVTAEEADLGREIPAANFIFGVPR